MASFHLAKIKITWSRLPLEHKASAEFLGALDRCV